MMNVRINIRIEFVRSLLIIAITCLPLNADQKASNAAVRYISKGHAIIAIVGTGSVGATIAYALLLKNMGAEIILVDRTEKRCYGEVLDLSDAIPFSYLSKIRQGTLKEAGQADIIIMTAGARRQPDQSRLELIKMNAKIVSSFVQGMLPLNQRAIMIVVSNPVDVMTYVAQKVSGLAPKQVLGSGTLLDTQRLCGEVAQKLGISEQSVQAYIVGEHGDSQCAAWSSARVASIPITCFKSMTADELARIAASARDKGAEIIALKGATCYGIGACVASICESIIFNQKRIMPISCFQPEFGLYVSTPAVVGENGVEQILMLPLNESEQKQFMKSVTMLQEIVTKI